VLDDLSGQPCRRDCIDGLIRSPDDLVSAHGIFGVCSILRTRQFRVPFRLPVTSERCQFWADCATNILEHRFPTDGSAKGVPASPENADD
jgi:hypothetical protein